MRDDLPGLDAWIQGDPPDPGSGRGEAPAHQLHCECCAFVGPLLLAIEHHRLFGHTLTWRGVRQDFSRILHEQFQGAQQDPRR